VIEELVSKIFSDRNAAHLEHWATMNEARHLALGAFYADVITSLDAVVESYIAMFGEFTVGKIEEPAEDLDERLRDTMDWIETNRDEIAGDSSVIGNLLDNLTAVYTKTVYLLRLK
jgi:hypothetical protein